jgi:hypothetical protein
LFVGFLFGIAASTLWLVLVDEGHRDELPQVTGREAPPLQPNAPAELSDRDRPWLRPEQLLPEAQQPAASLIDAPPSLEDLLEQQTRTGRAYFAAVEAYRDALANAEWSGASPPDLPILLPPEFDYLSRDRDIWHEMIQRERLDPVWSATTELQIKNYLAGQSEVLKRYGYPIVTCRATRCEAAFVAYDVLKDDRMAAQPGLTPEFLIAQTFRNQNAEVYEQSWGEQFGYLPDRSENDPGILNIQVNTQDNVTTILWHFVVPAEAELDLVSPID